MGVMKEIKEVFDRAGWQTLLSIIRGHSGDYELTLEDRAALVRSAEDVRAGRFVPDAEIAAFFERNSRA